MWFGLNGIFVLPWNFWNRNFLAKISLFEILARFQISNLNTLLPSIPWIQFNTVPTYWSYRTNLNSTHLISPTIYIYSTNSQMEVIYVEQAKLPSWCSWAWTASLWALESSSHRTPRQGPKPLSSPSNTSTTQRFSWSAARAWGRPWSAFAMGVLLFFWYKAVNSLAGQFEEKMEVLDESL